MEVEDWDEEQYGPLDLDAVRARYQPPWHFRIRRSCCEPHTPFGTSGVARTYYVVSGRMLISDGPRTWALAKNQALSLPAGSFTITYPEPVEHIRVLELPERAWEGEKRLREAKS